MARSRKRKKGAFSQEVKLLAALLSIVIVVAAVCIVMDKNDDNDDVASGSSLAFEVESVVSKTSSKSNTSISSKVSSKAEVVSGSVTLENTSSSSQQVDATVLFDDTDKIGNTVDSWNLLLVNSSNVLPKDYVPKLYSKRIYGVHEGGYQISEQIYDAYTAMVNAAKKDKVNLVACSIYRQYSSQERNYNNRVNKLIGEGMSRADAEAKAATVIARPGTSEHQTGMAVDFNPCTEKFETSTQYKWLSKNAENYGFIQRYKAAKSSITGIIDEPWHYRYVGVEHAKKMNQLNMCLEEYIEYLKAK